MAKLLIADDDPHVIRVLAWWLMQNGHQVLEARTGAAALELLRAESVDVLISDMNMPELNGIELARAVREELGSTLPILMLSSRCDQHELGEQAAAFGVQLHPKPFVPSRLVAEIDRLLAATPA